MSEAMIGLIIGALGDTLLMVAISGVLSVLFGLPMGILLHITKKNQLLENKALNSGLGLIVNIGRSIPFIILLVAIIPFTRLLVGTSIGTIAATVPLTIGAIPFIARLVEGALLEVPMGLMEAAKSMGATTGQTIYKILLPEAMPGIINALTITLVTLVNYSAMAGAIGGGGLGDIGIRYGYQRFDPVVMLVTVAILVLLVQGIQLVGDWIVRRVDHR